MWRGRAARAQTRTHNDVDLVVCVTDVPTFQDVLRPTGFFVREGSPPDSFVLANGSGPEVDLHAIAFDQEGNGVYRMQNGKDWIYSAEGFLGRGVIDGVAVRCLSPTTQVLGHAHGYVPEEKGFRVMEMLQQRFSVVLSTQLKREFS
jgi:lincosamide nucleotidyltransferase A/C/D/E